MTVAIRDDLTTVQNLPDELTNVRQPMAEFFSRVQSPISGRPPCREVQPCRQDLQNSTDTLT